MKFLVTLCIAFLVVGLVPTDALKKHNAEDYAPECVKEFGNKFARTTGKFETGDFSKRDAKTKCFAKCLMEKAGFFDNKAKFLGDVALRKLSVGDDKKKVESHLNSCGHIKGEDGCDYAFKLYECYIKAKLAA